MSTPAIDIRPDHWQIVRHILRLHVPQYAVWAFGSRAKWTAKPHSDLDLAIITDKPLPLSVSAALADDFSESNLPWKVDVVDWAATSESFRKVIERDKVVVQEPLQNSGQEWRALQDVVDDILDRRGVTPLKLGGDFTSEGHRVISAKVVKDGRIDLNADEARFVSADIYKKWMKNPLRADDVVMTSEAPLGELAYLDHDVDWVLGQRLFAIRPRANVLSGRFLYYVLSTPEVRDSLIARSSGTTVVGIRQAELRKVEVPVPPIEEQRAIARILGALDDKIELNRRMNQTLEAMARALFRSWFVDFDGVPQEDMQESELGLIPKGWRAGTLADFAALNPETWTKQTRPDEIFYVDLSSTKWGRIESVTPYVAEDAPSRAQRVLRSNDTIVGTVRPGNGSYAFIDEEGLTGSTGFAVLRPKREEYAALVYIAATAPDNIDRLANLADGGAYPAVRSEIVLSTSIAVADEKTIAKFSQHVFPMLKSIAHSERESRTLAALRDTLLPRLISGQLRVNQ